MSELQPASLKSVSQTRQSASFSQRALQGTGILLVTTVWISSGLFGLYILAFYASALYEGNLERWNNILPGLYQSGATASTGGIGLHFATGGIILMLGSLQLIGSVRERWLAFHRWVGRVYVLSCLLAAVGGLTFILVKGTIGGTVMDIGFGLYGVLMLLAAVQTYRHAVARRLDEHRAWAIRLYALAIGSWLYRMDYGFWIMLTDAWGHGDNFTGPFDQIMAFFFYLPNLLVAEVFIRARSMRFSPVLNVALTLVLLLVISFLMVGTYYFTKIYWGPAIIDWITLK